MTTIIVPKLGLRKLSFDEFDVYSADRVIDVPVVFPVTTPTILTVSGLQTTYHNAVLAWRRGNKASTELKRTTRRALHIALTDLASDCANQANGDVSMFLLTGFDIRVHGGISPLLPAPENFKLKAGDDGELIATYEPVVNNHGYEIWLSGSPFTNPEEQHISYPASKTTRAIPELHSG